MVPPLTGVVPAASSRGASSPGAVEFTDAPVFHRVVFDSVGGQSAHFDTRVVTQEVGEGHPAERQRNSHSAAGDTGGRGTGSPRIPTRTLRPRRWHEDSLPARSSTLTTCGNATALKTQEGLQHEENADHVVLRLPITPRSGPLHLTPRVPHPHQLLLPAAVVHLETRRQSLVFTSSPHRQVPFLRRKRNYLHRPRQRVGVAFHQLLTRHGL